MSRSGANPVESRERAVRMVVEVRPNFDSDYAAITAVAVKLGGVGTPDAAQVGPPA